MSEPSELERTLERLRMYAGTTTNDPEAVALCMVAQSLLRWMAADFDKYAEEHRITCVLAKGDLVDQFTPCNCGLDAARARWRVAVTDTRPCPICGTLVRVVGKTTKHYEPVQADAADERAKFEAWVTAPPYEYSADRFDKRGAWRGQYRDMRVQLAWEAWKEAKGIK